MYMYIDVHTQQVHSVIKLNMSVSFFCFNKCIRNMCLLVSIIEIVVTFYQCEPSHGKG